ncbi:MAG: hypothetical protein HRF49_05330 [bacterium]|jgi:hypothetical protein
MAPIKLKWWTVCKDKTLAAVIDNRPAPSLAGFEKVPAIVLENEAAVRDFSYRCHWQMYVEHLPVQKLQGEGGNCRMILPGDFGMEKVVEMTDFVHAHLRNLPGIHLADEVYLIKNVAVGKSGSGSTGRVETGPEGAFLILA